MVKGNKRLVSKNTYRMATMKTRNLIIYGTVFILLISSCYALCFEPDIIAHKQCIDTKCGTGYVKPEGCKDPCDADFNKKLDEYNKCLKAEQKESEDKTDEEKAKEGSEASISNKRGHILIKQPDGSWKEMPDKTFLKDGDTIKTDRASTVSLLLPDGSKVSIGPNSEFTFNWDGTTFSIKLILGRIRSWIKKFSHKFEVRTPSAPCAVRGTDFIVDYDADTTVTTVYLYEGIVDVGNTKGETFELNAGEMITVDSSGKTVKSGLSEEEWNSVAQSIEPEEELIPSHATTDSEEQKTGKPVYLIIIAIVVIVIGVFLIKRKRN